MKILTVSMACLLLAVSASSSADQIDMAIKKSSSIEALSDDEVRNLYTGVTKYLPDNTKAALHECAKEETRDLFYRKVAGKTAPQMQAYWARLQFTGEGTPPRQPKSRKEMNSAIAKKQGGIGYCDQSNDADEEVRSIWVLGK